MSKKPDPRFRVPRIWSNRELDRIATMFEGDVVNVSAGDDVDKEGRHYRDYFSAAKSYSTTNYGGATYRGFQSRPGEIELDLAGPLPGNLSRSFDVAFNHTTLEHILDATTAFHNLCEISRDIVIVVAPFCQVQHEGPGYKDYWRFTPTCLRELFSREGLGVVYESANDDFNTSMYLFFVGSRFPERWGGRFPQYAPLKSVCSWVGREPSMRELLVMLRARVFRGLS